MDNLFLLKTGCPQVWTNTEQGRAEDVLPRLRFTLDDVLDAEARLHRFAPLIRELFPETAEAGGIIESPLTETKKLRKKLGVMGRLFVKRDSELPIAGSVKARGGIYEVLKHTEELLGEAVFTMSAAEIRERLRGYTVQVGSTGNLGLSIGIMSAALGYRAVVHMSSDAKEWKKKLLREKGVTVVEYDGDYSSAVKRGREASDADPSSYFVDDENSVPLFMGYAVAALRLKKQLEKQNVTVDAEHPLCVYLPCGVGGAPGGICFGLKQVFGDSVKCWFVEPTQAPCMLAAFLKGKPTPVTELGLSGRTEADGLAVGTASALVYDTVKELVSGEVTVPDGMLSTYQNLLYKQEKIFIEPSSAAAYAFTNWLGGDIPDGKNYTHIAWATGGRLVPSIERKRQIYTEVAAGVIWRGDRFLIAKRPENKARGGLWEFVGGKLEDGETGAEALVRECREELGAELTVYDKVFESEYRYPEITVRLKFYNAEIISGEPRLLEHSALEWILPSEAGKYGFCPADAEFVRLLPELYSSPTEDIMSLADEKYGEFQQKIVPNIGPGVIVGVRIPELRGIAKGAYGKYNAVRFMRELPHYYYEENLLHALLLCEEKDYDTAMKRLEAFLPYVDNWAVCDALRPKAFKKHPDALWEKIPEYLASKHEFTVRFGIEMLMVHFLEGERAREAMERVYAVKRGEYYVKMAKAWFFAEAAARAWDEARVFLEKGFGDTELDRMTLRKCLDSFRVSDEKKAQIRRWTENNILANSLKL